MSFVFLLISVIFIGRKLLRSFLGAKLTPQITFPIRPSFITIISLSACSSSKYLFFL